MERGRLAPGSVESGTDAVAAEEPLEIRVRGVPIAVLMRMPGRERDLLAGFLASEGVLRRPEELLEAAPCVDPETGEAAVNVWNAALAPEVGFDPRERRFGPVTSSCGLCGARTLEELERKMPAPPPACSLEPSFLLGAFEHLRSGQEVFERTAGTHAAGLLREDGCWIDLAEDVGRHNAVDKVLGARLLAGEYPCGRPTVLLVSGRISFEIVQKAALARVCAVAGVSAPTSLAVDAARRFGLALYGLVRDGSANHYP